MPVSDTIVRCPHGATAGNCDRCFEYEAQAEVARRVAGNADKRAVLAFLDRPDVREAVEDVLEEFNAADACGVTLQALRALAKEGT